MSVAEWHIWNKFVERRPTTLPSASQLLRRRKLYARMSVSNHSIETDLVQVRRLELQHLLNGVVVDDIRSFLDLERGTVRAAECSTNKLLTMLV